MGMYHEARHAQPPYVDLLAVIWLLLGFHVAAVAVVAAVGDRLGRRALLVAGLPPAAATIWALTRLGQAEPATAAVTWVERLDLELAFRLTDFAILLTLLVSGIGALIFVYAYGYFSDGASAITRFTMSLLSFSAAMLGLIWSDSVWTLFLFWELTSITSFLLVGHKDTDPAVRDAARRALLITVAGGLALLAGLVVLVDETGTGLLSEMGSVTGTSGTVAGVPSWPERPPSRPRFRSTCGSREPWRRRHRSAPISTRPRWSRPASSWSLSAARSWATARSGAPSG